MCSPLSSDDKIMLQYFINSMTVTVWLQGKWNNYYTIKVIQPNFMTRLINSKVKTSSQTHINQYTKHKRISQCGLLNNTIAAK